MDYRSLVNKLEAISNGVISEATAPSAFKPTHFHKGNLGNKLPVMQAPDGSWWWEGSQEDGSRGIVPWQGDTLNRSGWNPASIDGIIDAAGKYIDFDKDDNWQTFKGRMDKLDADASSNKALQEKLKQLLALVEKYLALKAKKSGGQGARPAAIPPGVTGVVKKESVNISKGLLESFGYETQVDEIAIPASAAAVGGAATKVLGKAMPGVGAVLGAQGAYDSYKKGDYLGAALNGLSGAFSLVPGLGWVPALGFGMWQAGRELSGATDKYNAAPTQGARPAGDPKIQLLQKKLIAAGATNIDGSPLAADGKMGPNTQAAMKQFPNIKEGVDMNQPKSLAESIKELQNRLAMIEAAEEPAAEPATGEENAMAKKLEQAGGKLMEKDGRQFIVLPEKGVAIEVPSMEIVDASTPALTGTGKQFNPAEFGLNENLDEGFWDSIAKGAAKLAPKFTQGVKTGFTKGALSPATAARAGMQNKAGNLVGRGGKAVSNAGAAIKANPGKAALGVGAAGFGGGYLSGAAGGSGDAGGSARPTAGSGGAGGGQAATAPDTSSDDEMNNILVQIKALMKDLSTSQDPEIQKALADINGKLGQ